MAELIAAVSADHHHQEGGKELRLELFKCKKKKEGKVQL